MLPPFSTLEVFKTSTRTVQIKLPPFIVAKGDVVLKLCFHQSPGDCSDATAVPNSSGLYALIVKKPTNSSLETDNIFSIVLTYGKFYSEVLFYGYVKVIDV